MTNFQALIIAAGLIAGGVLAGQHRAVAQQPAGHFVIAAGINNAWRVDTNTGQVTYCVASPLNCKTIGP
jgi:hypothetical protein